MAPARFSVQPVSVIGRVPDLPQGLFFLGAVGRADRAWLTWLPPQAASAEKRSSAAGRAEPAVRSNPSRQVVILRHRSEHDLARTRHSASWLPRGPATSRERSRDVDASWEPMLPSRPQNKTNRCGQVAAAPWVGGAADSFGNPSRLSRSNNPYALGSGERTRGNVSWSPSQARRKPRPASIGCPTSRCGRDAEPGRPAPRVSSGARGRVTLRNAARIILRTTLFISRPGPW